MNHEEKLNQIFECPPISENPYNIILDMCCSNDEDEMRDWMLKPLRNESLTIATDAHILAFFKNGLADNVELRIDQMQKVNPVIKTEREAILTIPITTLKEKLSLCETEEDFSSFGKNATCDCCEGEGTVEAEFDYKGKFYTVYPECPICDGVGRTESITKIPNGKYLFTFNHNAIIGESVFQIGYLFKLFRIAQILKTDNIELVYQKHTTGSSIFRISDIEVLLMPTMSNEAPVFKIS